MVYVRETAEAVGVLIWTAKHRRGPGGRHFHGAEYDSGETQARAVWFVPRSRAIYQSLLYLNSAQPALARLGPAVLCLCERGNRLVEQSKRECLQGASVLNRRRKRSQVPVSLLPPPRSARAKRRTVHPWFQPMPAPDLICFRVLRVQRRDGSRPRPRNPSLAGFEAKLPATSCTGGFL